MIFNKIERPNWDRDKVFEDYTSTIPCTYSMTVNVDITIFLKQIKDNKLSFIPCILHGISKIVNKHKEFRMDIDNDGDIGYYDTSNPCFTIFHEEKECFSNVWTQYDEDMEKFVNNYNDDILKYKNNAENSKPIQNKNLFNVSVIPWVSFTGFNLNLQKGYEYFPPIFTIGKYFNDVDKVLLPLSIQVHHAVCDGFHLARFINELQEHLNSFNIKNLEDTSKESCE